MGLIVINTTMLLETSALAMLVSVSGGLSENVVWQLTFLCVCLF